MTSLDDIRGALAEYYEWDVLDARLVYGPGGRLCLYEARENPWVPSDTPELNRNRAAFVIIPRDTNVT